MFNDKYGLTQAVLDGRKTMTRRIIVCPRKYKGEWVAGFYVCKNSKDEVTEVCMYDEDERMFDGGQILPKYEIGEVVAVAQSYSDVDQFHRKGKNTAYLEYLDSMLPELKLYPGWGNKMFVKADLMPHHIKITGIKVERLQDISEEDCLKEGIIKYTKDGTVFKYDLSDRFEMFSWQDMKRSPREAFSVLIDKVSGKGTWESNPYVFAYEFKLVD